jgi:Domain of unknown function (DUF4214)
MTVANPEGRPILIHVHIPKTGGSTLNYLISIALGEHEQFACGQPTDADLLRQMPPEERDRLDFVFGHYPYGLHQMFSRPVLYLSCMRESRSRVLSFYKFVKSHEHHPLHDLVRDCCRDFSSFLELASSNYRVWDAVDNIQVRLLSGRLECRNEYGDALAIALRNVAASNFLLGNLELLTDLVDRLTAVLQVSFGFIPKLNASYHYDPIEEEVANLRPDASVALDHFTKWDDAVYTLAVQIGRGKGKKALSVPAGILEQEIVPSDCAVAETTSVDLHDFVAALYRALLSRDPDPTGYQMHIDDLRGGASLEDAIRGMLGSKEFHDKWGDIRPCLAHQCSGEANTPPRR